MSTIWVQRHWHVPLSKSLLHLWPDTEQEIPTSPLPPLGWSSLSEKLQEVLRGRGSPLTQDPPLAHISKSALSRTQKECHLVLEHLDQRGGKEREAGVVMMRNRAEGTFLRDRSIFSRAYNFYVFLKMPNKFYSLQTCFTFHWFLLSSYYFPPSTFFGLNLLYFFLLRWMLSI